MSKGTGHDHALLGVPHEQASLCGSQRRHRHRQPMAIAKAGDYAVAAKCPGQSLYSLPLCSTGEVGSDLLSPLIRLFFSSILAAGANQAHFSPKQIAKETLGAYRSVTLYDG